MPELTVIYAITLTAKTALRPENLKRVIEEGIVREAVMRFSEKCEVEVEDVVIREA